MYWAGGGMWPVNRPRGDGRREEAYMDGAPKERMRPEHAEAPMRALLTKVLTP